ncbi:hypothetical protein V5O48_008705 [Marasmius crinis-equi]|uniref:E3 ubiquitin ligase complex SCF subunit n=1 Tax=Marasmius crinis-equi TaxID=585013 RepID=A0ABR3FDU6_9AGAR
MIHLITSDRQQFTVDKEVVQRMRLLDGSQLEADQAIRLPNVSSDVLRKVLEYCEHHRSEPLRDHDNQTTSNWDQQFIAELEQQILFEVILAALYLKMEPLLTLGCKRVADQIEGKTPEEIWALFDIQNRPDNCSAEDQNWEDGNRKDDDNENQVEG